MSLTTGVVVILLVTTILFQAAVGAFFYNQQYTSQHKDLESQVQQLSEQAARTLAHPLWIMDTAQVGQIVHNFTLIPSVYRISVTDENGKTIYSKILGSMNDHRDTVKAPRREIVHVETVLGFVEVELSTEQANNSLHHYLISLLASIFVLTCVQVMTLYLLFKETIISSIKAIENYAAAISSETITLPEPPRAIFTKELTNLRQSIVVMVTALLNSEKGYRSIFENSLEGIFQTSLNGSFIKANPALTGMLGYSSSEDLRASFTDIGHQLFLDGTERRELIADVTEKGYVTRREIALRHREGHTIYCLISLYAIRNEQGEIKHLEGSLIDISERIKAEEQLASLNHNLENLIEQRTEQLNRRNTELIASEERYRNLVETIQEGILTVDHEGRLTFVNKQMSTMLGLDPPDMIGKNFLDFIDVLLRDNFIAKLSVPSGQSADRFEMTFARADDHNVHTLISPTILYNTDGSYKGAFAVVTDITTLKQLQTRLLHAQKLESIGQLAAGIAHEINTPTQYVGNNVGFLEDAFKETLEVLAAHESLFAAIKNGEASATALQAIEESRERLQIESLIAEVPSAFRDTFEGINRITKIVSSVKRFAHPGKDSTAPTDLNEAIISTITVSTNEWKYVADIDTDLDPALPQVPCIVSAINQVILNVIVNAAHAIADITENGGKGKGKITIRTRNCDDFVEIRVSDTGSGIPENIKNRIFDPFFTTKDVGKGTGQGLAIARAIITETHHGSIEFESNPGCGTTFIIRLPLAKTGGAS